MNNMDSTGTIMLPEPTLRRLPWYLAYIDILKARNVRFVSSTKISRALNVDASQIAKDLSFLQLKGKTRIGYEVGALSEALNDFLGFRHRHNAYIIGCGSLGAALIRDSGLANYGLHIVAGFDVNPNITGTSIRRGAGIIINSIYEVMRTSSRLHRYPHGARGVCPGLRRHRHSGRHKGYAQNSPFPTA